MRYEIVQDTDPQNPRTDMDNLGTMLYVSHKYLLGDRRVDPDEVKTTLHDEGVISLPVFAFIHGDVHLSTEAFGDPWDSGQCGVIYTTKAEAAEWLGLDLGEDRLEALTKEALKAEVAVFSAYLSGEVFGWVVRDDLGDVTDSCYGYYSREDAEADAKGTLACLLAARAQRNELTVTYGG